MVRGVVLVLVAACSGAPSHVAPAPRPNERVAASCERNVATAEAQLERGELRAALASLSTVPERRVLRSLAEATPCPAGDALVAKLRVELQLDLDVEPASLLARDESRALHHQALANLADGMLEPAIRKLEDAHAKAPHPTLLAAMAAAYTTAGNGKAARIAADRAIAAAERQSGERGIVDAPPAHTKPLQRLEYDSTGRWLVSAADDELLVWNAVTGTPVHQLVDLQYPLATVVGLARVDGNAFVTVHAGGAMRWWDIHRGTVIAKRDVPARDAAIALSPDRSVRAIVDGKRLRLDSVLLPKGMTEPAPLLEIATTDTRVAFGDARTLVTSGIEGRNVIVNVRDVQTGKVTKRLVVPAQVEAGAVDNDLVTELAASPDGKLIGVAGVDRTYVLERASGRRLATIAVAERDWPASVRFRGTEQLEVKGQFYVARTGKPALDAACVGTARPGGGEHACIAVSTPAVSTKRIELVSDGAQRSIGHADARAGTRSMALSPDGGGLAIGHGREPIVVDLATSEPITYPRSAPVVAVSLAADRRLAVAAGRRVVVYDRTRTERFAVDHPGSIHAIAFRPDGGVLAYTHGSEVILVDTATWKELRRLKRAAFDIGVLAWSADGKRLLSHGGEREATVWDAETGTQLATIRGTSNASLARSGTRLAMHALAGQLHDLATGAVTALPLRDAPHDFATFELAPDGASIAIARPGAVELVDAKRSTLVAWPGSHVDALAFHPNNRVLFANNSRRHVAVIDLASRVRTGTFLVGDGGTWGAFDRDGHVDGDATLGGLVIAFGSITLPATLDPMRRQPKLIAALVRGTPAIATEPPREP